jgi:hypothetical protein
VWCDTSIHYLYHKNTHFGHFLDFFCLPNTCLANTCSTNICSPCGSRPKQVLVFARATARSRPAAPAAQNMVFQDYWIYSVSALPLAHRPGARSLAGRREPARRRRDLCGAYDDFSWDFCPTSPFVGSSTVANVTLDTAHFSTIVPPSVTVDVGGSLFG